MSGVKYVPAFESGYFSAQKNERQYKRVIEYLASKATADFLENPLNRLAEMLLDRFGYSITEGRILAEKICRSLNKEGRIECRLEGNKIIALRLLPERTASKPQAPLPVKPRKEHHFAHAKKKILSASDKGHRAMISGANNQIRFYRLMICLSEYITSIYDDGRRVILKTTQSRHRDLADREGEDVNIHAVVAYKGTVSKFGRFIYDVKSSFGAADEFNSYIYITGSQKDAKVKKAIVINPRRSDSSILSEVLNDMERQKLFTRFVRDDVEKHFSGTLN